MLIDSHCHIPHEKYDKSVDDIVHEAVAAGVEKMVSIGTSIQDSQNVLDTVKSYENVYATVGVYPHEDLDMGLEEIGAALSKMIDEDEASGAHKIVGIGECGIDIPGEAGGDSATAASTGANDADYPTRDLESQKELFKLQIGLAIQHDLPLIIHNRNGDQELLDILTHYKGIGLRGVVHCYVSDWEFAKKLLHLNFYISFTGIITYPSAGPQLLEAIKNIPRDMLMVETDAPYLAPQEFRGQINYPKYVKITAAKAARIRNTSLEDIEKYTYQNTCRLFNI